MTAEKLYQRSVEIILENQHESGAYVACPSFPTYHFSWYRDSAYIAHAMDLAGESESAARFHRWAETNILKREEAITALRENHLDGYKNVLHTRYRLDGSEGQEEWENFQLDGFGTWLWSLEEHLERRGERPSDDTRRAVELLTDYLTALWQFPCYDLWEENSHAHHIYTLSAVHRGLKAAGNILGVSNDHILRTIKQRILERGTANGSLCKYEGNDAVDSSLLGVYFPNAVLDAADPLMERTVARITTDLYRADGLHRYCRDSYYGGGIWILLTAWLGIWHSDRKEYDRAEEILSWIAGTADSDGGLAEQLPDSMNDPSYLPVWEEKWGPSARPLLWSHAKYIMLYRRLQDRDSSR